MKSHPVSYITMLTVLVASTFGQTPYNSINQICCNGTVHDISDPNSDYYCCGNQPFNHNEFTCCPNDIVAPLPEGGEGMYYLFSCCLEENTDTPIVYNASSHVCCDGHLVEKTYEWGGCCSKQYFNYDTEFCCNEEVYEDAENLACCADEVVFDPTSQLCCNRWKKVDDEWVSEFLLHDTTSNTSECCELEMYDTKTHACCDDTITDKPDDIPVDSVAGCCAGQIYDQDKQICCDKWELVNDIYEITSSKVHDKIGNQINCCEDNVIDYDEEVCCSSGLVLPKPEGNEEDRRHMYCCGEEIADYSNYNQRCINEKLVTFDNLDMSNCGDEIYDVNTKGCCYLADKTYDSKTELCCGNAVMSRDEAGAKEGDDDCCYPY